VQGCGIRRKGKMAGEQNEVDGKIKTKRRGKCREEVRMEW